MKLTVNMGVNFILLYRVTLYSYTYNVSECLDYFQMNWGNNILNVFIPRKLKEQLVFAVGYYYENIPGVVNFSENQ